MAIPRKKITAQKPATPKKRMASIKKTRQKKALVSRPPDFTDHFDLMKMIYGSCASCPVASGCGAAETPKDEKKKSRKK